MAWEARHFNFGVGEEFAYLIKQPKKKSNSLYSFFIGIFKNSEKRKTSSLKEIRAKG